MTTREDTINGLRQLADWLEAHPEVPAPSYSSHTSHVTATDLPVIAKAMGQAEKRVHGDGDTFFRLAKTFDGGVDYYVYTAREQVCERKQVGTRIQPAREEQEIPVYEWECASILGMEGADA